MGLTADDIANTRFTTARRGYDPVEVDRFVRSVVDAMRSLEQQPASGFDQVGDQVATVLQSANDSAAEILAEAEAEAVGLRAAAEAETAAHRAETDRMHAEATTQLETARAEAEAVTREADDYALTNRESAEEYALGVRTDADDYAARTRARADEYEADIRERIDSIADEVRTRAEDEAVAHSQAVLRDAQQRLDQLLAAERTVRERIGRALTDVHEALEKVPGELQVDLTMHPEHGGPPPAADEEPRIDIPPSEGGQRAVWAAVGDSLSAASNATSPSA